VGKWFERIQTESFLPNVKYESSSRLPEMLMNQNAVGTTGFPCAREYAICTNQRPANSSTPR